MNPQLIHEAGTDAGDDQPLPCPHALIASTLALMTTWADPAPGCALDVASLRSLLARKLSCNLMFLAEHPALSPAMRQVMAQARERWQLLASASGSGPLTPQPQGECHAAAPDRAACAAATSPTVH